jgi:hypothetical protein
MTGQWHATAFMAVPDLAGGILPGEVWIVPEQDGQSLQFTIRELMFEALEQKLLQAGFARALAHKLASDACYDAHAQIQTMAVRAPSVIAQRFACECD